MYISSLLINVGDNPDRPRPGRQWLRNIYHVHQRLCMAFPSKFQRQSDPRFVKPYNPCGFPDPRPTQCTIEVGPSASIPACSVLAQQPPIHVPRDQDHNFLFRINTQPGNRVVILVQSALRPDWDYAFQNAQYLLDAPPQQKELALQLAEKELYRFRLRANPTKKIDSASKTERLAGCKKNGKRIGLFHENDQVAWLLDKGQKGGFTIPGQWREENGVKGPDFRVDVIREGWVRCGKEGHRDGEFFAVRFEGLLTVTDPVLFRQALAQGLGSAKAFGFGLLSVAPVQGDDR